MNNHETYPYVTFSFNRYATKQTDFTDLLLPELNSVEIPNINSINHIDTCLNHLESTPLSIENKSNYQEIRVPSINLLRVLFTLSVSKPVQPNIVRIHGLQNFDDYTKSEYDLYNSAIENPTINSRCIDLLLNYAQYINSNFHESLAKLLYDRIKVVLFDLLSPSKLSTWDSKGSLRIQQPTIDANFSKSPIKKSTKAQSTMHLPQSEDGQPTDLNDTREISDSEDEVPKLMSFEERDAELLKYKLLQPNFSLPTLKLQKVSKSPSRSRASSPICKWNWNDILVFDDELVTKRLSPRFSRYNIWLLINWAFYCAENSSEFMDQLDYNSCNSHYLYKTYRDFLNLIFDFLIINFLNDDELPLIGKLISQLSTSNGVWFDRLVEYTLNGLERRRYVIDPKLCYMRDNNLIKLDFQNFEKNKSIDDLYSDYSDIFDSISLRFKILLLIYIFALKQKSDILSSGSLTSQIATKFINLNWKIFQEFYNCGESEFTNISKTYNYQFLLDFSHKCCRDIIKSVEIEIKVPRTIKDINYKSCHKALIQITGHEVYQEIIDVNDDYEQFFQKWMRLNVIFEWLLIILLTKQEEAYNLNELIQIQKLCRQGDISRVLFFEEHFKGKDQEWIKFTDIFENIFCGFDKSG